jgi:hypothetical protein
MTIKKKSPVFIIICCCFLMGPVLLSGPADALNGGTVAITGNIPLVTYNISVTDIDQSDVTITWNTNGNANSTVEYGTTTGYGSNSTDGTMTESHTISLSNLSPGTVYHYQVISADLAGNRAVSTDSTFTTTAVPVTEVTSASGGGGGAGYGGKGAGATTATGFGALQQANPLGALLGPPEQVLAGLPGLLSPANNPGIAAPAASESYPMGFSGLIYNANGLGTLHIDLAAAQAAHATVTVFVDRVEVYQHHSPGVLLTFWGDHLEISNGTITGPVSRAEFVTDPLNATLEFGNVSGSVHAALPVLIQRVDLNLTIPKNVSTDTVNQFQYILSRNGLRLDTVAYTLYVQKFNLTTGPANVTFTIPASWVDGHGGKDAVRITRISEETGTQEVISTVYEGVDAHGNMIFRGDSPNGMSLFGLVTAESNAAAQKGYLNAGMVVWLTDIPLHNPVQFIGAIALLVVIVCFVWWKERRRT